MSGSSFFCVWEKIKQYRFEIMVLFIIALVQCCFIGQKESYHMDEIISFQMSNGEYTPWLTPTQPVGRLAKFMQEEIQGDSLFETIGNVVDVAVDVVKNRGNSKAVTYKADVYEEPVWISSQLFRSYVTTGQSDRFNYASVYFNATNDIHPPLHSIFLHTVSSLVPEVMSPFVGCLINLLMVLGCCVCFMKLADLLAKEKVVSQAYGKWGGILLSLCFGLSAGATASILLIRMYAMLTFWCLLSFYIHTKKWLQRGFASHNKSLILVTVAGFLTQYFFLYYCLILSVVMFLILLGTKRWKEALRYVRSMMTAAVIGVCLYPNCFRDVLSSSRGMEAVGYLKNGLEGFGIRLSAFCKILWESCLGNLFGTILMICLLCGLTIWHIIKRGKVEKSRNLSRKAVFYCLFLIPVAVFFFMTVRTAPYLVDRYVMPMFPFVFLGLSLLLDKLSVALSGRWKQVVFALVVVIAASNVFSYHDNYLYKGYREQVAFAEEYGHLPCICLYDGHGYYNNMVEFTIFERSLLMYRDQFEFRQDRTVFEGVDKAILLLKPQVDQKKVLEIIDGYGWTIENEWMPNSASGDIYYLVRIQ